MGLCVLKACLPGICSQVRFDIGALRIYRASMVSLGKYEEYESLPGTENIII